MAIKGKTKRRQGRAVRRVAVAPRPQFADRRRSPWWKAPAFAATLAVVALLVTLVAAGQRVQFAWQRDDVRRFTEAVDQPVNKVRNVSTTGTDGTPGFNSAQDLAGGKLKPADLTKRAQTWQQQLVAVREQITQLSLGTPGQAKGDGTPVNGVGGRVASLSPVRDGYLAALGYYDEAAKAWGAAAAAKDTSKERDQYSQSAAGLTTAGQTAMDAAAAQLADVRARYDLDMAKRLPGESDTAYKGRYSDAIVGGTGTVPGN